MRHPESNDKVIIRRDCDGHWTYFSVRDNRDNGTVIDFLQKRRSKGLGQVRKELRAWLQVGRPHLPPEVYTPSVRTQRRDAAAVKESYAAASYARESSRYLAGRGLQPETLADVRFSETFRVDARGNVLFGHLDPTDDTVVGYEIKNLGFTGFAAGGRKTFWRSAGRPDDERLVIVEASIDALSYHQMLKLPRTRYLSTGGSFGPELLELLAKEIAKLPAGGEVVIATDNDPGGEKAAEKIETIAGGVPTRRHTPPREKDWNDYLQWHVRWQERTFRRRPKETRLER